MNRAMNGTEKPVWRNGRKVGTVQQFDNRLLQFLLKAHRPDLYQRSRPCRRISAALRSGEAHGRRRSAAGRAREGESRARTRAHTRSGPRCRNRDRGCPRHPGREGRPMRNELARAEALRAPRASAASASIPWASSCSPSRGGARARRSPARAAPSPGSARCWRSSDAASSSATPRPTKPFASPSPPATASASRRWCRG